MNAPRVRIRLDKIAMYMTFVSATLGFVDQLRRTNEQVKVAREKKRRQREGFGFAKTSKETDMWTRRNTSSGEFRKLRSKGVKIGRSS